MINDLLTVLHGAALIGTGIMAGLFFVFSNFAMQSFSALPYPMGLKAMQGINKFILNKVFLSLFFLTGILPVLIALLIGTSEIDTTSINSNIALLLTASSIYFVGCFMVTATKNVPMNKRLALCDTEEENPETYWLHYLKYWTAWNHIRTISSSLATMLYTLAFIY